MLIAPHRKAVGIRSEGSLPDVPRERCPFCPGHEKETEATLLAIPESEAWRVRVVGNKYPLTEQHEVLIETQDHDGDFRHYTEEHMADIVHALLSRVREHRRRPESAFISIFRNRGRRAGSSQPHPHMQLASLSAVPEGVLARDACARGWQAEHGTNLLAHAIAEARDEDDGLVHETADFASFVPYAPHRPYELWVAPKFSEAFDRLTDARVNALARSLLDASQRLHGVLGNADMNVLFRFGATAHWNTSASFWYVEFAPRMSSGGAGFELSTGMDVLVTSPEDAAAALREVPL